ncbi:transcriptional regulator GutM [Virgibacillus dokdonensis]|uniref:DNA-binding transcriptional activator GutM n=1 Tax=Virgibacillus dokdonensis TaxID=302167 RepID=A0A2K9J0S0_9BACI|nr:transcriptional regulator GutM [Virgibacillus dokdonensis]AUJ23601.1 DNA-binding transcriptional activator GutM [Virgibacillus dokdonensis]
MFWYLIILIGVAWLVQSIFGFLQIRHFNRHYAALRSLGRVAIGKRTGLFRAGTVVMFSIDKQDRIIKAKRMQGVTVLSRVKDMTGFAGKKLPTMQASDYDHVNKLTKIAIKDAVKSFNILSRGGELEVKKGLVERLFSRKK